jgi:hypothetical protein
MPLVLRFMGAGSHQKARDPLCPNWKKVCFVLKKITVLLAEIEVLS